MHLVGLFTQVDDFIYDHYFYLCKLSISFIDPIFSFMNLIFSIYKPFRIDL